MIQIESITPSAADVTDCALVRRGVGPLDHTMELVNSPTFSELADAVAEIIAARGDRSNLNNRITAISNVITPNAGAFVVGNYYDNAFRVTGSSSLLGAVNRMELYPFMVSTPLRIDQIGVECTTAVASATGKCLIYSAGADGWPDALVYETATPLDFSGTGYKSEAVNILFDRDRVYWVGIRHSSTATLRAIATSGALSLGPAASTGATYYTVLRRTLAFATAAPDPWAFVSSDLVANINPTSIRMRANTV